jgi:hypothetical protein
LSNTASAARSAILISTVAVLVGIGPLPYGYYMLLRLCLCVVSLFLLFSSTFVLPEWTRWALGASALLYNPVFPVYLREKPLWIAANVATISLFWYVSSNKR